MKSVSLYSCVVMSISVACADNEVVPDGGVTNPDAAISNADAAPAQSTVFAVGTDFVSSGVAATVTVPELAVTTPAVAGVASTDPVVRRAGSLIYIVNRFGADNITIVNADGLTLVDQISTEGGSNPQDIAVKDDIIYVAALNTGGVLVIDATRPTEGVQKTIDLSALDAEDGKPNCSSLTLVGDTLFVGCGILDDNDQFLAPRGPGKVAVIDTTDDTLVETVMLANLNPTGRLHRTSSGGALGGDLLVATVPSYADLTMGCIERISTGTAPAQNGCLVDNSALGGYAGGIAVAEDDTVWIAVVEGFDSTDFGPLGKVHTYAAGQLSTPVTPSGQRPFDVALCPNDHVVISDASGGLRVYTTTGAEITTAVLDIGLPPVSGGIACY